METVLRSEHAKTLLDKVKNRTAQVAVVGLGYVGLPTAVAFAEAGFRVHGADLDARKVDSLNLGISPLKELGLDDAVARTVEAERFSATGDVAAACDAADLVLLIVPTPVTEDKQPDLSYVHSAADAAARVLRAGQLVVLESTTYPGTSDEVLIPALEKASGLKAGVDFGVAYCPERYNPGDAEHTLSSVHRVIGAITADWAEVATEFYGVLNDGKITRVRDLKTAEASKVIENIQRDLNIALVNELALIFEKMGIDTHEVVDAAATKWNFVPYRPGPGVGGHCLPVDPYYLTSVAERLGYHPRVILAGRGVNDGMPAHVVGLVVDALNDSGRALKGAKVAVLGVAYKAETGDARESPAVSVVRQLAAKGAELRVVDPHVSAEEVQKRTGQERWALEEALDGAEAVVLLTPHSVFTALGAEDLTGRLVPGAAVVDASRTFDFATVAEAGFVYRGVGRGLRA
ncbi:MAG: nucleotide sugar dehydrogenase [Euryarchaeota archaeon]|nr:nucleotide sugar dehydrogenase [Euryarchaeota archaeon]